MENSQNLPEANQAGERLPGVGVNWCPFPPSGLFLDGLNVSGQGHFCYPAMMCHGLGGGLEHRAAHHCSSADCCWGDACGIKIRIQIKKQ